MVLASLLHVQYNLMEINQRVQVSDGPSTITRGRSQPSKLLKFQLFISCKASEEMLSRLTENPSKPGSEGVSITILN